MTAGKLIIASAALIALAGAEASAATKTEKKAADKPAANEKARAKAPAAKTAKAVATKPAIAKPATAEPNAARATSPAPAADATPWFDAPLSTPVDAPAPARPAADIDERDRYGSDLGLGVWRGARNAPRVSDKAKDDRPRLNRAEVRRLVRSHRSAIQYCHGRAARAGERATQLVLTLAVDSAGGASEVTVSELGGRPLARMSRCVATAARAWSLPRGTRGGRVEIPMALEKIRTAR
jgi:hypothetical protein